jgi:P27 family predicted phage terminase small subunit
VGRARKPTALKVVAGTDRADRRNGNEPEPALLNDLEPPAHIPPRSAVVWRQVASLLRAMQVLTVADVIGLELMCDAIADYRYARDRLCDDFVVTSAKGSEMVSQWLVAKQMAAKRAEALMSRFGMDPAARARLMINPQTDLFDDAGAGRFFAR